VSSISILFPYTTLFRSVGNIMNSFELRGELEKEGSIFQTQSDTELLAHLIKRNGKLTTRDAIIAALKRLVGAYTYVLMTPDKLRSEEHTSELQSRFDIV